jgi:hypothetical protein
MSSFDKKAFEDSWLPVEPGKTRCERKFLKHQCIREENHLGPHRTHNTSWYEPGEMEKQGVFKKRPSKESEEVDEEKKVGKKRKNSRKKKKEVVGASLKDSSKEAEKITEKISKKSISLRQKRIQEMARSILSVELKKGKLD